ncbi:hypothetical protein LVB87_12860 [Lysobacter sp. KIS68-7]|uniref:hypothetical protein n=1 Tax=Lysobacter sp. KIS68-7 TaxID=2904252 RepID=UPI001E48B174|nr:hypothetical protein [Lysobacter sp. KIS68-7]UHQ19065.1 hypothetical protein LVB87_12860 [Lysobacter sp. KIS68-7]
MTTRTAAPFAGISWLKNSFQLLGKRPKTLIGAGLIVFLLSLVPTCVSLPLRLAYPNSMPVFWGTLALSLLAGIALAPLMGGYLQMVDRIERGEPARASDVFGPYRQGLALPLIGFSLLLMALLTVAVVAVIVVGFGPGIFESYATVATNPQAAGRLAMPTHFWPMFLMLFAFALFWMGVHTLGYAQVAIAGRGPLEGIRDGAAGTIKNVVPLVVLMLAGIVLALVIGIVFGILVAIVGTLATLVAQSAWALVLVIPVYVALLLVMYPLTTGVMYFFWRDVCGQPRPPAMAETYA